jgi:hypothetical protein
MFEAERINHKGSTSKKRKTKSKRFEEQVGWISDQLRHFDHVSRDEFVDHFLDDQTNEGNLRSDWCRGKSAIIAVKACDGVVVEEQNNTLFLRTPSGVSQFATKQFQSDHDVAAKQHIGELVAAFLADEKLSRKMSVFLGSGSTILHVGLQMCKDRHYNNLFATVNIPMAALWCQCEDPPVKQVSFPEADLDTNRARLATIQKPSWTPAIAIVGADGCHYDAVKDLVSFYAMDRSVAINTNVYVMSATDLVIVCLASEKMGSGRNMGPRIELPPGKEVRRALVTDKAPGDAILGALKKAGWTIITEYDDWKRLPEAGEQLRTVDNVLPFPGEE